MVGLSGNTGKKYQALGKEQKNEHLAFLRQRFTPELFTQDVEAFFKAWMKALGQEFYIHPSDFTDDYTNLSHLMATKLIPLEGYDDTPGQPVPFKTTNGTAWVTNDAITFDGEAEVVDLFEMAYLASRDEDMMTKGVSLKGDLYQRAMLEMSLRYIDGHRGESNLTIRNALTEQEQQDPQVQAAMQDFNTYLPQLIAEIETHAKNNEQLNLPLPPASEFEDQESPYTPPTIKDATKGHYGSINDMKNAANDPTLEDDDEAVMEDIITESKDATAPEETEGDNKTFLLNMVGKLAGTFKRSSAGNKTEQTPPPQENNNGITTKENGDVTMEFIKN